MGWRQAPRNATSHGRDSYDILLRVMPFPDKAMIAAGNYPKWDNNTEDEKEVLRHFGLPEDYHPTEDEAYR